MRTLACLREQPTGPAEVRTLQGYHYLLGPVAAMAAVGVLILVSRWAFGSGSRPPLRLRQTGPADYGLLLPVATVRSREDADMLRQLLADAGIRGTVVTVPAESDQTYGGFQLLVFPASAPEARKLLATSGR